MLSVFLWLGRFLQRCCVLQEEHRKVKLCLLSGCELQTLSPSESVSAPHGIMALPLPLQFRRITAFLHLALCLCNSAVRLLPAAPPRTPPRHRDRAGFLLRYTSSSAFGHLPSGPKSHDFKHFLQDYKHREGLYTHSPVLEDLLQSHHHRSTRTWPQPWTPPPLQLKASPHVSLLPQPPKASPRRESP